MTPERRTKSKNIIILSHQIKCQNRTSQLFGILSAFSACVCLWCHDRDAGHAETMKTYQNHMPAQGSGNSAQLVPGVRRHHEAANKPVLRLDWQNFGRNRSRQVYLQEGGTKLNASHVRASHTNAARLFEVIRLKLPLKTCPRNWCLTFMMSWHSKAFGRRQ